MTVRLNSISIRIGDASVLLTLEEAHELYDLLADMLGKNILPAVLETTLPPAPAIVEPPIAWEYTCERTADAHP